MHDRRTSGSGSHITAVLINRWIADGECDSWSSTLLALPLGTGSLLDLLVARCAALCEGKVWLVNPHPGAAEKRDVQPIPSTRGVQSFDTRGFAQAIAGLEPSDYLLLVDARCWPHGDYDLATMLQATRRYRGATHALAVGDLHGAREQVERDEDGRIRRIQRLYDLMHWPQTPNTAPLCSLVPARAVRDAQFADLLQLRNDLLAQGYFSQDLPVACGVDDLQTEHGILALADRTLHRSLAIEGPAAFSTPSRDVRVGRDATVHPSVRIVPPVIIHPDAVVSEGATLVGPTTIGPGAHVGRGAIVNRSLVCNGALVEAGAAVTGRVVSGLWSASSEEGVSLPVPSAQGLIAVRHDAENWEGMKQTLAGKRRRIHLAIKRGIDVVVAAASLIVLSPLLFLVALLIKLTSRGPVFFSHSRETIGGREFPCIKFRTMVADAHRLQRELYASNQVDGPQFKLKGDPRVTALGAWLRATNIDELPQLFNVLAGHMSLIGPRPSPFRENQICVPWRRARLSVRPGITGLWQLCRNPDRSQGDFHEWIHYDVAYVRDFSIWLDVQILVATVVSMAGRWRMPMWWLINSYNSAGEPNGTRETREHHARLPA